MSTNRHQKGARKIVGNQGSPFQNGKIIICKIFILQLKKKKGVKEKWLKVFCLLMPSGFPLKTKN